MLRKIVSVFLIVLFGPIIFAQEILSLQQAIQIAIDNEQNITIAKNNATITHLQNNWGNAGMSPQFSLNAGANGSLLNSHQVFSSGTEQNRNAALSNSISASVAMNWTVFDGMKMFAIKKRLKLNESLSSTQLKQQIENTISQVMLGYYDIVRIQEMILAAKKNLNYYEARKKLAALRFEVGSSSKVDLLLAQTDMNRTKSQLLQLELQKNLAKANLNTLLNRETDIDFIVTDSIVINYNPLFEELKKSASLSNTQLLLSKQNESIAQQLIKEAKANYFPTIQLNSSYNFLRNQSQSGIVFLNQQHGLTGGLTLNWLLFNGLKNRQLVKERELNLTNQQLTTRKVQQWVDANVYIGFQNFLANRQIAELEKENLTTSEELLNISNERFKEGKTNILETIEVQKKLEEAQSAYINALFQAKKSETDLLRLNGVLVGDLVNKQ